MALLIGIVLNTGIYFCNMMASSTCQFEVRICYEGAGSVGWKASTSNKRL